MLSVEFPAPPFWLMGVIGIGMGLTLWWLAPDIAREHSSRSVPPQTEACYRRAEEDRGVLLFSTRCASVACVVFGVVLLVAVRG